MGKFLAFLLVFLYAVNCMTDRTADILREKSVAEQNKARAFLGQPQRSPEEPEHE